MKWPMKQMTNIFGGAIKRNATDAYFSDIVRIKAKWICERCYRDFSNNKNLFDCAHYISRGNHRTRWNFDNVLALCRGCHDYFGKNPDDHTQFMMKKLGEKRFAQLQINKTRQWHDSKVDEKIIRMGLRLELKAIRAQETGKVMRAR